MGAANPKRRNRQNRRFTPDLSVLTIVSLARGPSGIDARPRRALQTPFPQRARAACVAEALDHAVLFDGVD